MLKRIARTIIATINWRFARFYISKNKPVVIGVAGSVGKTGTKRAIAHVLSQSKIVAWQEGNYNDLVSVPLVVFGLTMPTLFNPFAWLKIYAQMTTRLLFKKTDVIVLELGTDAPGQIKAFAKYLHLDIAVITAISPEHMANFESLADVAREELAIIDYADHVMVSGQVMNFIPNRPDNLETYGKGRKDHDVSYEISGKKLSVQYQGKTIHLSPQLQGEHQNEAISAAVAIGLRLKLHESSIKRGIETLQSMPGRMNILEGKDNSMLIDDTYNSSPNAVRKALDFLYDVDKKKRIAVLGSMNEMGKHSAEMHRQIASYCDPQYLNLVITIGTDANTYLAPTLKEHGLTVESFSSPYEVGQYLIKQDLHETVILFKGSQNGVFLEESVKLLLLDKKDREKLVRQSSYWLKQKRKQFKELS